MDALDPTSAHPDDAAGNRAAATTVGGVQDALSRYFDLMHDCDLSRFDEVFAPSAHLHGYRDGAMATWSTQAYREVLGKRASPASRGALRRDEVLLIDVASRDMVFTKVRLRINEWTFVDYLTWHRFGGLWLITSKGFHLAD